MHQTPVFVVPKPAGRHPDLVFIWEIRVKELKGSPSIWAWEVAPTLTFFILLQPFSKNDRFALELAWSEDGEFPWDIPSIFQSEVSEPHGRERYPCWEADKEEVWDLAPEATAAMKAELEALSRGEYVPYSEIDPPVEQLLLRVKPSVEDAIQKLTRNGLPQLSRVAEHRGIRLAVEADDSKP